MKIRIKGNSLRYRLTKSDVSSLATTGYIEEQTQFGQQALIYALQRYGQTQLAASFVNNKITVFMPATMVAEWTLTNRIGFEDTIDGLFLLVEKDFACLDNVAEDQSDNYPNPNADKC